jgi:hypothetical protein
MELGNFFTAAQINALKAGNKKQENPQPNTSNVSDKVWELLYDIAFQLGQKLGNSFWERLEKTLDQTPDVVVYFKGKHECEIATIKRDKRWLQHMGEMLKRGYVLVCFANNSAWRVTWENWKHTYNVYMPQTDKRTYDEQPTHIEMVVERQKRAKEREFYELAKPIRSKKSGHIRISFEEAREFHMKQERVIYETKVVSVASKILKAM